MPLYEYQCRKCGHCFEELVSASSADEQAPECPECRSTDTERLLSAFSSPSPDAGSLSALGGSCGSGGFT